jgi:D-sedoheptulose 7-phosphate isomerase
MEFIKKFLSEVSAISEKVDPKSILRFVDLLVDIRENEGRLFFIGSGGGAGNASHAVCDFRKLAGIESYSPSDNPSELTARINDEGWESSYSDYLKASRINSSDGVVVFSVGGGDEEKKISVNLVRAVQLAKSAGAKIFGVVGRSGGYTAKVADACVIVPAPNSDMVTPHTEAFQAVIWHLVVSHPRIQMSSTKWESMDEK